MLFDMHVEDHEIDIHSTNHLKDNPCMLYSHNVPTVGKRH